MSNTNLLGSEEWAFVGSVDPDAHTAGAKNSDIIDMSLFEQILVVVHIGSFGSGATVACKLQEGAVSNMSDAADITGKAITTLSDSSPTGSNDGYVSIINLRGDELTEGDRYVRAVMTIANATTDCTCVILGKGKTAPASNNDASNVQEIIS
jgi:hypothetical protein